jgi:hypothetical protein
MIRCTVDIFGTGPRQVEVELKDETASLTDLIAALRHQIPELVGGIIDDTENRLRDGNAFHLNGHHYVGDEAPPLQEGDHVGLVRLLVGG